jgi:lipopolysaccharide transport system permease protein
MQPKTIIENSRNKPIGLQFRKIWEYRVLIKVFTLRDVKVQYTQTKLGIIWSFIQAITAALIINFFFGILMNVDTGEIPYIVFAFPGMIAWYYFAAIISFAGTSLMQSQHIIKKIYFPKLVLPLYKTMVGLVDLIIWFIVYIAIMIIYSQPLYLNMLLLPIPVFFNIIAGLSIAIWLAAITVRYRDALLIIPFLVGFGIFVTPVFFGTTMIPPEYHFLIHFNPMAGVIALYRWCLIGTEFTFWYMLGLIPTLIIFIGGLFYFRKVEATMADLL